MRVALSGYGVGRFRRSVALVATVLVAAALLDAGTANDHGARRPAAAKPAEGTG